jgi:hypothetical protein
MDPGFERVALGLSAPSYATSGPAWLRQLVAARGPLHLRASEYDSQRGMPRCTSMSQVRA